MKLEIGQTKAAVIERKPVIIRHADDGAVEIEAYEIASAQVAHPDGTRVTVRAAHGVEMVLSAEDGNEHWLKLQDWAKAGGRVDDYEPHYAIRAARFANADGTAVVLVTELDGDVLISEEDRPALWAKLAAWRDAGGAVAAYVAPPAPEPQPDLAAELAALKQLMLSKGIATAEEIEAAVSGARSSSEMSPELEAGVEDSARAAAGDLD